MMLPMMFNDTFLVAYETIEGIMAAMIDMPC